MKKSNIFFIKFFCLTILLNLFFISKNYSFQFGFGTKGFIRKTLEKGQEEGKISKTKDEKPQVYYSGKISKFDLSQARYIFVSARSNSTINPVLKKAKSIYYQPQNTEQKVIFKIKENGEIEEVNITDENGNIFDVNVNYIVKMGTEYLSVGLEINGIWIIKKSTQIVNGSTQTVTTTEYQKLPTYFFNKYLVRIKDGAAWTGEILPTDYSPRPIRYDDYGNYYFIDPSQRLIKLKTSDMSWRVITAESEHVINTEEGKAFWVDKFGNILYNYSIMAISGWKYRKISSPGELSPVVTEIPQSFVDGYVLLDSNRDVIFMIKKFEELAYNFSGIKITSIKCNQETNYEIQISSFLSAEAQPFLYGGEKLHIISTGDRTVSFMSMGYDLNNYQRKFRFTELNLSNGTTNYCYEVPFSSFNATQQDNLLSYQIVNSTTIYVLFKTPQNLGYKYSLYVIYPIEQKYELLYETTRYAIQANYWQGFSSEVDGSITVYAYDLHNEGVKVLLKIIPKETEQILYSGKSEIYYLTKVW